MLGRDEGMTKLLLCHESHRVLGCGIVRPNAGNLIAEAALAVDADDIAMTIHPHPIPSKTFAFFAGTEDVRRHNCRPHATQVGVGIATVLEKGGIG